MPLTLHDTLTRQDREVAPLDGKVLRLYCCGPTVYGPAHIGNFRTFVVQDVFRRVVELGGLQTLHVRNLTDVDDKTIRDSQKAGQSLAGFTRHWTEKFHADCAALNLLAPHVEPSAVAHIPHQIRMIQTLIERGHAYVAPDGSVYFRITSFAEYGRLSHLEERELKLGTSATDSDEYSKDSLADFVLWKARKAEDGPNFWPSPWGEGRPGWHLECSAMALEYLGEDFDVHSGGIDLVFPHHENEIAQSCCSTHGKFAHHWFHVTHLMVDGGKMSKSLGNLYTLEDLQGRGYSPEEVRYVLIGAHYRAPLNFTFHSLDAARQALQKLAKFDKALRGMAGDSTFSYAQLTAGSSTGPFAEAWSSLNHDLNVPGALGAMFGIINKTKTADLSRDEAGQMLQGLHFLLAALGLSLPPIREEAVSEVPADVAKLAEQRWQAKQSKDWAAADALRKELDAAGWIIKDSKDGYQVLAK